MLTFQIELTNNNSNNNNNNNNNNSNDCHNIFFQMRYLKTSYRLRFTNLLNIFQQFDDEKCSSKQLIYSKYCI